MGPTGMHARVMQVDNSKSEEHLFLGILIRELFMNVSLNTQQVLYLRNL